MREPIPAQILNAPRLTAGLQIFYDGFLDLTSCRSFGMSEGPIGTNDILLYCNLKKFDEELTLDFVELISRMDSAYLSWRQERRGEHGKPA